MWAGVLACLLALVGAAPVPDDASPDAPDEAAAAEPARPMQAGGLAFEANHGQHPDEVAFVARQGGGRLALTRDGGMEVREPGGGRVGMGFLGAAEPAVEGVERAPGVTHYLRGGDRTGWVRDVPSYREVAFAGLYPGVDLVWRGADGRAKYDLVVAAGADPDAIRLGFDGVEALEVDADGDLVAIAAGGGRVTQRRPYAYQEIDGVEREVAAAFVLVDDATVGFELGAYEPDAPLVIDPEVAFSTYVGGSGHDRVEAVAVDAAGDVYAAGWTDSLDLPTESAFQTDKQGEGTRPDAFVVKYDPDGVVQYATYVGGTNSDEAHGVALDAQGRAHVTGHTLSGDFPVADGAFGDPPPSGQVAAFAARLTADGSDLAFTAFLGQERTRGRGIALGPAGAITVAGFTSSDGFPVTADAHQDEHAGEDDAFVAVLDPDAEPQLRYATYLGGSDRDGSADPARAKGLGVAVDAEGRIALAGTTRSLDFPTTPDGHQGEHPAVSCSGEGCERAFVALLDPGAGLRYASYLGGDRRDVGRDVAVSGTSLFVAGLASSSDFPVTVSEPDYRTDPHTCDPDFSSPHPLPPCADAFVARFDLPPDADGTLAYATRIATDTDDEGAFSVAAGAAGAAYLTGATLSEAFPVTEDAAQSDKRGAGDVAEAFVTVLTPDAERLAFSTYLGGTGYDRGAVIAVDGAGGIAVGGLTASPDFPVAAAAQDAQPGGLASGWVARLRVDVDPRAPAVHALEPDSAPAVGGTELTVTGRGFAGASAVRFGEARVPCPSARCTIHDDGQLTVTAPPHHQGERVTGPVFVTVLNAHGSSAPGPAARLLYGEGAWEPTTPLASARFGHTATVLPGGEVLVAGCHPLLIEEGEHIGDCPGVSERYDPAEREWTPTGPGEPSGPAVLLADGDVTDCGTACRRLLVVACTPRPQDPCSGQGGLYEPATGAWEPVPGPARPRVFGLAATRLHSGEVLVTGDGTGGCKEPSKDSTSELFDPRTRSWRPAAPLAHGRGIYHTQTLLADGTVLALGGFRTTEGDAQCHPISPPERFYPDEGSTGVWREVAEHAIPPRTAAFTATLLTGGAAGACGDDCDRVLVVGGRRVGATEYTSVVERYDPVADAWLPTEPLPTTLGGHTATELPNGRVLVTGGRVDGAIGKVATTHLYDPLDGGWRSAGTMRTPRGIPSTQSGARHTATVLSSDAYGLAADPAVCALDCGKVLVVGGSGDASAELYTPAPAVTGLSPARGEAAGGTTVTIEGTGLTHGVREVRFGGQTVACTPPQDASDLPQTSGACRVIDYSTLEVDAPAMADRAQVDLEVVGAGGLADAPEPFSFVGPPGQVTDVSVRAVSESVAEVSWSAVGETGVAPPPAGDYLVVQSAEGPVDSEAAFLGGFALCGGMCRFEPAAVGQRLGLTVTDLSPGATYHYAVRAVDADGRLGPLSDSVSVTLPDVGFGADAEVSRLPEGVVRLAGEDRIATAVAASRQVFDDGSAGAVVLARADAFPDGLAGVPLAALHRAPLLLTPTDELDARVEAELARVLPAGGRVFVLGGPAALAEGVEARLDELGFAPLRLAGADRYATAAVIAEHGLGAPDRVLLATGTEFADAATAGAAAARAGAAVLLTGDGGIPEATGAYLDAHGPQAVAVGGPAARAAPDAEGLVGATRYETAVAVARRFFGAPAVVGVATGERFPDALAGGAHAARYGAPVLLSRPEALHPAAGDYLAGRSGVRTGIVYGGPAALGEQVADDLAAARR